MQFKSWQGELKAVNSGNGGWEGYGSLIGIRDDGGDIVDAGAYLRTIEYFKHHGFIADGHNWDSVASGAIGTVVEALEDSTGLYLKTEYHSTPNAQAARTVAQERLARGKSVGLSIGYSVGPDDFYYGEDGARHLTNIKLYEVSQVNVPMLREAGLTSVKGHERLTLPDELEMVLAAIEKVSGRVESLADLRASEGRKRGQRISRATRAELEAIAEALEPFGGALDRVRRLIASELEEETEPPARESAVVVATAVVEEVKPVDPMLAELRAQCLELYAMHRAI